MAKHEDRVLPDAHTITPGDIPFPRHRRNTHILILRGKVRRPGTTGRTYHHDRGCFLLSRLIVRSWPRTAVHFPFPRRHRNTHTDPSWQSTKTGYYRTHTPSRPIRRGCFLLSRYVRNFFSGHGILSHLASIVLLFPLEWPRTAVHLPFPRCRQPHRAH